MTVGLGALYLCTRGAPGRLVLAPFASTAAAYGALNPTTNPLGSFLMYELALRFPLPNGAFIRACCSR